MQKSHKNVLLLQHRLNPNAELNLFNPFAQRAGVSLTSISSLLASEDEWNELVSTIHHYPAIITGGSSDIDHTIHSDLLEIYDHRMIPLFKRICELKIPTFAICFSHQAIAKIFGGKVDRLSDHQEIGTVALTLTPAGKKNPFFKGIPNTFNAIAVHKDCVVEPPPGATILATTSKDPNAAMHFENFISLQAHPEDIDAVEVEKQVTKKNENLKDSFLGTYNQTNQFTLPYAEMYKLFDNFFDYALHQ